MTVVVPVLLPRPGQFFHWNHASIQVSAAGVLELDGGVRNLKMLLEDVVQVLQNARAL